MKREKRQSPKKTKKNSKEIEYKEVKTLNLFNVYSLSVLIILIGFISFSKYLTGEYLFFFKDIGSDSINQIYPAIVHKINLISEGFFSKWSFYKGMGNQEAVLLQTEPYSILRQTIDFFAIKTFGEDYLVIGKFLMVFVYYFLFTGIISYFYFRTININKASATIAALLITFSGFVVVGSGWGFASHVFKIMALLFSFEQLYLKKRWYFFPFAVIWLSSNVFVLYVYSFFLLIYSLFRFFSEEEDTIKHYFKLIGKMLLLGFVGLMMNFAHVFQSFMKMYNSPRVAGTASYSNMLTSGQEIIEHNSIFETTILRFFSNDILGSGSNFQGWSNYLEAPLFYIGILTLLLFPQVFIHLNRRKRIVFGSFLGFWLLTLFFPYLRYAILAFTGDYFRYGFDFFIPFTLLFYAIYSLNQINKAFKINLKLLGITLFILLIALFFPYKSIQKEGLDTNLRMVVVFLLFIYSGILFFLSKPKYKSFAQIALLVVVVFELSYFSYKSYAERVPVTKAEFNKNKGGYADGSIKAVNYIKSTDNSSFYRIEKDYQSGNSIHGSLNDALAQSYYGTTSYSSFNQLNYVRFLEETGLIQKGDESATRWITGLRGYPLLQTFGNVKYYLSKSETPEFLKFGFDSLARKNGITILKNKYYLPFGYTLDKYIDTEDFKTLINYQISPQSLSNIYTDLSRTVNAVELNSIIDKLKTILNVKYPNLKVFSESLEKVLTKKVAEKYKIQISKYSVSNFKAQTAILNGFVYEKSSNLKLSDLEKININDSSKIIPASKFNFDVYKRISDNLKQDTLQITSFKQSEIKGNINLSKTKMLFFTIPFDKGWKIKVNGEEKILSRVNFGFTGIILPKGEHKIELYYIPEYTQITNIISLISVIGFWLFLAFYFYKKKRVS